MARSYFLEDFFQNLADWGIIDVLLPFLLIFTIIFAVLQKTKILGDGKKNLNMILAIIFGLLFVFPHVSNNYGYWGYSSTFDPVQIINAALPAFSIVIVAVVALLILIGIFGQDAVLLGLSAPGWIAFLSLITILLIFGSAAGWWWSGFGTSIESFFGTEAIAILIMILVFGIIIAFITGESKEREERTALQRLGFDFSKLFGGKK